MNTHYAQRRHATPEGKAPPARSNSLISSSYIRWSTTTRSNMTKLLLCILRRSRAAHAPWQICGHITYARMHAIMHAMGPVVCKSPRRRRELRLNMSLLEQSKASPALPCDRDQ